MSEREATAAVIHEALVRLGFSGMADVQDIQTLTAGMSGSSMLAFTLDRIPVVLKGAIGGGQDDSLLRRKRREVRFYRDLADLVPISVPQMLGSVLDEGGGPLLLLAASEPAPESDAWPESDFTTIARQLGHFHTSMRGVSLPEWVSGAPARKPERCGMAADFWRALATDHDGGIVPASLLSRMEHIIRNLPTIEANEHHGPVTLCHGDFHAGNFLRAADGGWIWADWQEVHTGHGVEDFAYLWERAFSASDAATEPPFAAMVDAYWAGLTESGDPGMSRAVLERALAWAELRGWLIEWPPYIRFLSPVQTERVIARIGAVIDWWDGDR